MVKKRMSLSQAIEGYFLFAQARRLSPHTLRDYDTTFRRFEQFLGRDPPLDEITPAHLRDFLNSLSQLSAKTLRNYYTGLSALWTWAVKEQIAPVHILRSIDPPRPDRPEILPYTEHDVKAMIAACDRTRAYRRPGKRQCSNERPTALRDRAILLLLLDTGMRASELCGLRLEHTDLQNQRVLVTGKGRKQRLLPICPLTAQALWRYLAAREDTPAHTAYLFASRNRTPMTRHTLRQTIGRIGQRAGVPGANVHRFRHTFAIAFLRNGGQIFALQRILGHSTLTMVNRYLAIAQADIERAHQDASPVANWML